MNIITSKAGWLSILTAVIAILSSAIPIIPSPWGAIVSAVLGIFAFYHIGNAVGAARQAGAKGI